MNQLATTAVATPWPAAEDPAWGLLGIAERRSVRQWLDAFDSISRSTNLRQAKANAAAALGVSFGSINNKYHAWKRQRDWRVVIDGRREGRRKPVSRVQDPEFRAHLGERLESHQRCSRSAFTALLADWHARRPIPGYEDLPGWPARPAGWSERNLYRQSPSKPELRIARHGLGAAHADLPQIFSTRVGLWPAAFYAIDDVWHDTFVRWGDKVTRVLELGVIDLWSACRFAWGSKPRIPLDAMPGRQRHEHLKESNTRFFLASFLSTYGYSPRGTTILAEHGTAAIREGIERILHDATGGLIKVRRSGITGREQAILGGWQGQGRGNPRFKGWLESLHNLIHNRLSALPGPTGHDRTTPEPSEGLAKYQADLLRWAAKLPPQSASLLIHPLLDYSEFCRIRDDVYKYAINGRTDHDLEGWIEMGRAITEYRISPDSDAWLPPASYMALPEPTRAMLSQLVQQAPATWSRRRLLSPGECWDSRDPAAVVPLPSYALAEILGEDLAREVTVKGSYIRFQDSEISHEELIYEARLITVDGRAVELRSGDKFAAFANPFAPKLLMVCDAKLRCLGHCRLVKRVSPADEAGLEREFGHAAARLADRLQDTRIRHAGEGETIQRLRAHNQDVIEGRPVLPADKAEAMADSRAAGRLLAPATSHTCHLGELLPTEEPESPDPATSIFDLL